LPLAQCGSHRRPVSIGPRGFHHHRPQVRIAGLGDTPSLLALSPLECSLATMPAYAINCGAPGNRDSSPNSATTVTAETCAWLTNTNSTSRVYQGQLGHTYSFYSLAQDLVGNVEGSKTSPEASTQVTAAGGCGAPIFQAASLVNRVWQEP
jgi:hypothetical protein